MDSEADSPQSFPQGRLARGWELGQRLSLNEKNIERLASSPAGRILSASSIHPPTWSFIALSIFLLSNSQLESHILFVK